MKNFAPKTRIKHNWLNDVDNKLNGILDNFFIRSEAAQSKDSTSTKITKNGEGSITSGDIAHREDNELFFFDLAGNRKGGTSTQLLLSQNGSEQIVDMVDSDIEITYSGKSKKDKDGNFNIKKKKKKINSNSTTDSVWDNDFVVQKKKKKLSKVTSATSSDSLLSHRKDSDLFFFDVSGKKINNSLTPISAAEHTHFNDVVVDMVDSDLELTYSGSCKKKKGISLENGSMEKNEDSGYKKKKTKIKYNHVEEESSSQKMEKKLERENNKKSSKKKKKQESIDSNTTILNSSLEIVENDTPKKKKKRKNKNLDKEDTIKDLQVLFTSKKMKNKHKSKTIESNTKLIDLNYEKELELSSGNISNDFKETTTRKKKKKKCQNEDTLTENNEEKHPSQTPDMIEDTHLTCEKVNKKKKKEKAKEINPEKDSDIQIHNSSIKIVDPETPEKKKIKSPIEKEAIEVSYQSFKEYLNMTVEEEDEDNQISLDSTPEGKKISKSLPCDFENDSHKVKKRKEKKNKSQSFEYSDSFQKLEKNKERTYSTDSFETIISGIIKGTELEEVEEKLNEEMDIEIHENDIADFKSLLYNEISSSQNSQNSNSANIFKKTKKKKEDRTYSSTDNHFDTLINSILEEDTNEELSSKYFEELNEGTNKKLEENFNPKSKKNKDTFNSQNSEHSIFKKSKKRDSKIDYLINSIHEDTQQEFNIKRKSKNNEEIVESDSESVSLYQSFNNSQNTSTGNVKKSKKNKNTLLNNSNPENSDNAIFRKSKKKEKTYISSDHNFDTVIDHIIDGRREELKRKCNDNEEIHEIDDLKEDATKIVECDNERLSQCQNINDLQNTSTGNSKKSKKDQNTSFNNSNSQNSDNSVLKKSKKKERTYTSSDYNFDTVIDSIIESTSDELKKKCKGNEEIHEIDNLNEDTTKIVECDSESISQYQSFNDLQNTGTGNSKKSKKDKNTSLNNSNAQNSDNTVFKKSKKKERTYTSSDYNFDTVIDSIIESASDELKKKSKDNEEIHEIDNLNEDATKIVECDSESISHYQSFNHLQNTGTGTIIDTKMGKNPASQDLFDSNDEREDTIDNIKAFLKADLKHWISQQKIIEETKDSGFEDSDNITKTKKNTEDIVSLIEKQKKKKYNDENQTIDEETNRSIKDLLGVIKDRNRKLNRENNLKRKKSSREETSDSDEESKIEKKNRIKRSKSNNQSFHISPGDVDQCSDPHESTNRTKLNVDEIFSDNENDSKEIERRKFRGRKNSSYTENNSSDKDISMDSRRNNSYSESETNDYEPTEDELDVLKNIEIRIPFDIPVLHMINRPSKPTLEDVKNAKILNAKFGAFSKQEDAMIVQNWQQFCESHHLSLRPIVFFRFHRCCSKKEKIKFLQYISHGLNDRMPFRVHFRFKKLFEDKQLKYGRYTAKEDKEIVEFINTTNSLKPFRDLGLLLNRCPNSLEQRYAKLTSKTNKSIIKWDLRMAERMIKAIMEIVKTDDVKNLKYVIMEDAQWKEVSKILDNIPTKKLQRAWKINIHSKLFMKESTSDVKEDLVYMMIKNKENDFRTISWEKYAEYFKCITSIKLQDIFRTMMTPLPKECKKNLKSVLEFLSTHLETRKRSRIQYRYKFKDGHLTCKRIQNKET